MRQTGLPLLVSLALLLPAAHAATVFTLQGTLTDGTGTFLGTITDAGEFPVQGTLTDDSFSFTLPANYLGETLDEPPYIHVDVFSVNQQYDLSLYFPELLLVDGGGALCSTTTLCPVANGTLDLASTFSDGSAFPETDFSTLTATPVTTTPVSATPEPGSFVLLGTGALALAGATKRRWSAPRP